MSCGQSRAHGSGPNPLVLSAQTSTDDRNSVEPQGTFLRLKVRGRTILVAGAIDYPQSSGRDQEINSQAVPILEHETLTAQSAHIDTVSGATYTSDGHRASLQAALDAAHVG